MCLNQDYHIELMENLSLSAFTCIYVQKIKIQNLPWDIIKY